MNNATNLASLARRFDLDCAEVPSVRAFTLTTREKHCLDVESAQTAVRTICAELRLTPIATVEGSDAQGRYVCSILY